MQITRKKVENTIFLTSYFILDVWDINRVRRLWKLAKWMKVWLPLYIKFFTSLNLYTSMHSNVTLTLLFSSNYRYIEYFGGLLAGSLRISASPLFLTHLTVLGVPLFEPTGCRAFFKVYEGLTPVYTSDLYSLTNAREFTVNLGGLRLRGDILVRCYHRIYSSQGREVMFSLQVSFFSRETNIWAY